MHAFQFLTSFKISDVDLLDADSSATWTTKRQKLHLLWPKGIFKKCSKFWTCACFWSMSAFYFSGNGLCIKHGSPCECLQPFEGCVYNQQVNFVRWIRGLILVRLVNIRCKTVLMKSSNEIWKSGQRSRRLSIIPVIFPCVAVNLINQVKS